MPQPDSSIGILHPGVMGSALGQALRQGGRSVLWAYESRSEETAERARKAGLLNAGSLAALVKRCEILIGVVPAEAAHPVAMAVAKLGYKGLYVEASSVTPATACAIAATIRAGGGRPVDAAIEGPPPEVVGTTKLYLCGPHAAEALDALNVTTLLTFRYLNLPLGGASALKGLFMAHRKGATALLASLLRFDEMKDRPEGPEATSDGPVKLTETSYFSFSNVDLYRKLSTVESAARLPALSVVLKALQEHAP
ncbi:MAG: NAD(P)-binding domain-containing protein [Planctomycetota bacterium]|nr:NAD(P)-binding domain-containing protein [Planctomycetota bacterium]